MSPKYDVFERFSDGSSLWRACVVGLEGTRLHMQDLELQSPNKFYAIHVGTGRVVSFGRRSMGKALMPEVEKRAKAAAA